MEIGEGCGVVGSGRLRRRNPFHRRLKVILGFPNDRLIGVVVQVQVDQRREVAAPGARAGCQPGRPHRPSPALLAADQLVEQLLHRPGALFRRQSTKMPEYAVDQAAEQSGGAGRAAGWHPPLRHIGHERIGIALVIGLGQGDGGRLPPA